MQKVIKPIDGLHTDNSYIDQPDSTLRWAEHIDLLDNMGSIQREDGIVSLGDTFSQGRTNPYTGEEYKWKLIGKAYFENSICVFLVDEESSKNISEIGLLEFAGDFNNDFNDDFLNTGAYLPLINSEETGIDLTFSSDFQIDAVSRISFGKDRLVYFTDDLNEPRFINIDRLDWFTNVNDLSLFGITKIPITKLDSIINGGNLTTGVYQFAARYVGNDESFTTDFGIVCNPIPINDEFKTDATSRNRYDGAESGTNANKSINLVIENIDPSYRFVEIAVVERDASLISRVTVFRRVPTSQVDSNGKLYITYSGIEEVVESLSEEALLINTARYATAKNIAQKDNRLFLSNLKLKKRKNLQALANKIKLSYIIKEVEHKENVSLTVKQNDAKSQSTFDLSTVPGFENVEINEPSEILKGLSVNYSGEISDYKDENIIHNYKSYKRGEVYSFAFRVIWNDGSSSPSYHIPGALPSEAKGSVLKPYISNETYPQDFNYPTEGPSDGTNVYVRHHKMPELYDEPHFKIVDQTSAEPKTYIRILGVKASVPFTDQDWLELKRESQYIIIEREPRNTPIKKSILAQGITLPSLIVDNSTHDDRQGRHPHISICPLTGQEVFSYTGLEANYSTNGIGNTLESKINTDINFFFSPETDLIQDDIAATKLVRNLTMMSKRVKDPSNATGYSNKIPHGSITVQQADSHGGATYGFYQFIDVNQVKPYFPTSYDIEGMQYIEPSNTMPHRDSLANGAIAITPNFTTPNDYPITNYRSFKNLAIKTTNPILRASKPSNQPDYVLPTWDVNSELSLSLFRDDTYPDAGISIINSSYYNELIFNLYDLKNELPNQYGRINSGFYTPCAVIENTNQNVQSYDFYSGDTFICKYPVISAMNHHVVNTAAGADKIKVDPRSSGIDAFIATRSGFEFRTLIYFFVETQINTNFRHREINDDSTQTGVDYFPRQTMILEHGNDVLAQNYRGLLDTDVEFGRSRGYNTAYSLDNLLSVSLSEQFGENTILDFSNRVIPSDQSIEGELYDSFRKFLVNNYHDIPKHTGPINNMFLMQDVLYLHTSRALWRTYVNEKEAIVTNQGQLELGSGGLFPVPSKKIADAGTLSKWGGIHTPNGYCFVDNLEKKVWLFTPSDFKEISLEGMHKYFTETFDFHTTVKDNPVNDKGVLAWYDDRKRKIMISSINRDVEKVLTNSLTIEFNNSVSGSKINIRFDGLMFQFIVGVTFPIAVFQILQNPDNDQTAQNFVDHLESLILGGSISNNYSIQRTGSTVYITSSLENSSNDLEFLIENETVNSNSLAPGSGGVGVTEYDISANINSDDALLVVDFDSYGIADKCEIVINGITSASTNHFPGRMYGPFDPNPATVDGSVPVPETYKEPEWYIGTFYMFNRSNYPMTDNQMDLFEQETGILDLPFTWPIATYKPQFPNTKIGNQQRLWINVPNKTDQVTIRVSGPAGTAWQLQYYVMGKPNEGAIFATSSSLVKTQVKKENDLSYTLSYSLLTGKWISYHRYAPSNVLNYNRNIYSTLSIEPGELFLHNSKGSNTYYKNEIDSKIQLVLNDAPLTTKVFDSVSVISDSFFDKVQVLYKEEYSDTVKQESSLRDFVSFPLVPTASQIAYRRVNNQYNFHIPRGTDQERIKNKYCLLDLYSENDFRMQYLIYNYRQNFR